MDADLRSQVIATLTASLDAEGDERAELFTAALSEPWTYSIDVPSNATGRQIADAVAEHFQHYESSLIATFCAAFGELADEHDAGSSKSSREILQELARDWARDS